MPGSVVIPEFRAPSGKPVSRGRFVLAWGTVAAGLLALACGLFLSITEAVAEPPASAGVEVSALAEAPAVAVVIDDIGLDRAAAERAMSLPGRVSLALLPYADAVAVIDAEARARGHQTLVHLPMEPTGMSDPGPGALTTWLPADVVNARVEAAVARAPGARGVNNHMGSRFTACAECVAPVAAAAVERGLFVLDSVTTPESQLAAAAAHAGAAVISRDVFLDADRAPTAIAAALEHVEAIAREEGAAVAIGHPYPETLAALQAWMPAAAARGVRFVAVGDLVKPQAPAAPPARF